MAWTFDGDDTPQRMLRRLASDDAEDKSLAHACAAAFDLTDADLQVDTDAWYEAFQALMLSKLGRDAERRAGSLRAIVPGITRYERHPHLLALLKDEGQSLEDHILMSLWIGTTSAILDAARNHGIQCEADLSNQAAYINVSLNADHTWSMRWTGRISIHLTEGIPETLAQGLVGRPLRDYLLHPVLDDPALTILRADEYELVLREDRE